MQIDSSVVVTVMYSVLIGLNVYVFLSGRKEAKATRRDLREQNIMKWNRLPTTRCLLLMSTRRFVAMAIFFQVLVGVVAIFVISWMGSVSLVLAVLNFVLWDKLVDVEDDVARVCLDQGHPEWLPEATLKRVSAPASAE